MLKIKHKNNQLEIYEGDFLLLKTPFASAIKREKTYSFSRGITTQEVVEKEHIRLDNVEKLSKNSFRLSAEGHSLVLNIEERELGCEIFLEGEEGWAYEFKIHGIDGEAVFGGGEQYRQTNLRGLRVVNFVSEHIKASTLVEKVLLPDNMYREKEAETIGTYAPMPVFVTDQGRLFYFDTASDGVSKFGTNNYRISFDKCPKSFMLLKGKSYEELARALAKKNPPRMYLPEWCLDGMIVGVQGGNDKIISKAFTLLDSGAKISGIWSQDWSGDIITVMGKQVWWEWEYNNRLYPNLPEAIKRLESRGVKFLGYINPYLVRDCNMYNLFKENGWLIKNSEGEVYHIKSTTFDAGMIDLTNPEAAKYVKDVLIKKNMLEIGVKGWMCDFGEYLPADAVLYDGDAAYLHNEWPRMWAQVNREAVDEYGDPDAFFFTRSGYLGEQCYAPIMWNGDQHTDYTKDYGMPCVMPATFSLGFSGVPLTHFDIGGFFSMASLKRDAELITRWTEMAAFSPLMRSHEAIRPWANAQPDDFDVAPYTVRLTNVHVGLKPYIQEQLEKAKEGIPAMRPDFWPVMDYSESKDMYSYFFGDDLYVCPVIEEGAKTREVHLPKGDWVGFWDGKEYAGGSDLTADAPLGTIPVYYRKGSKHADLFKKVAADAAKKQANGMFTW